MYHKMKKKKKNISTGILPYFEQDRFCGNKMRLRGCYWQCFLTPFDAFSMLRFDSQGSKLLTDTPNILF